MIDNTKKTHPKIRCVHCGAEYVPGELYMPGALIGHPEDIVRDSFGKLLYDDYRVGEEPDMIERYICDYCDRPFIVEATITYKTMAEEPEKDFSRTYVSLLD